jgi:lipopolysaccharide transport protein LptA
MSFNQQLRLLCVAFLCTLPILALSESTVQDNKVTVEADRVTVQTKKNTSEFSGRVVVSSNQFLIRSERLLLEKPNDKTQLLNAFGTNAAPVLFTHIDINKNTEWLGKAQYVYANTGDKTVIFRGQAHLKQWQNGDVMQDIVADKISLDQTTGELTLEGEPGVGERRRVMLTFTPQRKDTAASAPVETRSSPTKGLSKKRLREDF